MDYYLLILIICTEGRGSLEYIFYVIMICKADWACRIQRCEVFIDSWGFFTFDGIRGNCLFGYNSWRFPGRMLLPQWVN